MNWNQRDNFFCVHNRTVIDLTKHIIESRSNFHLQHKHSETVLHSTMMSILETSCVEFGDMSTVVKLAIRSVQCEQWTKMAHGLSCHQPVILILFAEKDSKMIYLTQKKSYFHSVIAVSCCGCILVKYLVGTIGTVNFDEFVEQGRELQNTYI